MKSWLIRKLGGIPAPEEGIALLVYEDQEGPIVAHVEGGRYEMIDYLGGVPLPKAGEGQIVVKPVVRKLPVRKKVAVENVPLPPGAQALKSAIEAAGGEVHVTEMKMFNLCDNCCQPSVQECRKAVKETDSRNNTVKCDQYKQEVL